MKLYALLAVIVSCAAVLPIARCQDSPDVTPQCGDLDVVIVNDENSLTPRGRDCDGNAKSGIVSSSSSFTSFLFFFLFFC